MAEKHPGQGRTEKERIPIHTRCGACHPSDSVGTALRSRGDAETEGKVPRKCSLTKGAWGLPIEKVLVEEEEPLIGEEDDSAKRGRLVTYGFLGRKPDRSENLQM